MKGLLFIPKVLIVIFFTNMDTVKESKSLLIAQESSLEIIGTSNVTDFTCQYNIRNFDEPISIKYQSHSDVIRFDKSRMVLRNSCFDCGGKGINKDFNELLITEEHPQIIFTLKEIKKQNNKNNKVVALIEIEIAGLSHSYLMETEFLHNKDWFISGKLKLNISDFNLKAPKKMLGLIVVSENIEISFKLILREC